MGNRNFTPFPILTTDRLTLRPLSMQDQHGILALRSDPEINKYLNRVPSKTVEDAVNFIDKVNDNFQKKNSIYWAISLTSTKTFVGTLCLFDFSNEKSSCEIGYELLTNFQGQGIMKEAAQAVIDFVFQTLNLNKILALTHSENQPSTKLLSKLHFVKSTETERENHKVHRFILAR